MKALVLFSGGVDSSTCLALAVKKYGSENVVALSVFYGQKHTKEIQAANAVADYYGVEHIKLDLSLIFQYSDCSLLAQSKEDIPHESYAEQLEKTDGSPVSTYVPFRNGLFISAAASVALSKDCGVILYGAHADDSAGNAYPDCSPAFNEAMNKAVWEGSGGQVKIEAPFVGMNKSQVVKTGLELGVPYELTWSCYEGGDAPCGVCGTCRDRLAAFEENGITDPLNDPKSVKEIFDIMKTWENLRGEIHIENNDEYDCIIWNVADDLRLEISITAYDGTICVFDPNADSVNFDNTYHWHPDFYQMYSDMRDINSGKIEFAYIKYGLGKKKIHLRAGTIADKERSDVVCYLGKTDVKKECSVCSHLEGIKIEHPSEMLSCVEMVKELIASGNFEKLKSNFELEKPKTEDGYWQDDVMYYSFRCKNCGQEFSLCCETYHGSGGSFSKGL